jgi:PAS domain S-box-containing protein
MEDDRNDRGTGHGVIEKDFLSENVWRALILTSAAAILLFSIYCLSHGITIIFMHLYYFPIVLLAYRYRYRGFMLATVLSLAYIGLVVFFHPEQVEVTGAFYRFAVFIGIAAVVAYLSERLAAAHMSQKEGLGTIRNLQQFQESVITNANVWITVLAPDGTILVWNDAAEAISGYKRGDVLKKRTIWRDLYRDKEYRHKVTREIERVIGRDTYLENFETEIRCADGTQKTIVWNTRGIRDPTGTIQSYIAIGRDITEQKRAEKALRESTTLLNEVGEMAHVGGWELDVRTKAVHWTKETYRIHDISEDEKFDLSKAVLFFDLPGRSILEGALQRCMEIGEPFDLELPFTSAKGRHLRTRAMGRAVGVDGEVVKLEGAFQDITEQRKTGEALKESTEKFRQLFTRMPSAVAIYDAVDGGEDFIFKDFNFAAEKIEGIKKDDLIGKRVTQVFPGVKDFGIFAVFQRVWRTGQPEFFPSALYRDEHDPGTWRESWVYKLESGEVIAIYHDITERKRAELELVSTQQTLKDAHRLAYIGTWDWVMENDTVTWSEELYNIAKRDPSLPAPTYAEHPRVYTPASWDRLSVAVTRALTTGESYNLELELVRPDGSIRWVNAFGGVKRDGNGKVIGLHGTVQDITERKLAEKALQESEERFRTIIHSMQFGIVIIDAQTHTILDANEKALEMIGGGTDVVVGSVCHRFICPAESGRCPVTDLGQTVDSSERVLLTLRGEKIPILKSVITTTLGGKKVLIESFIDITERKQMEERIADMARFHEGVIGNANVWLTVLDATGKILVWNRAAETISGYHADEVIGKKDIWRALYPDKDYRRKITSAITRIIAERNYLENFESEVKTKDGGTRIMSWNTRGVTDAKGKDEQYITIGLDITERKQAEEKLKFSNVILSTEQDVSIDGILVVDESGKIISFNRRFIEIWGIPQDVVASRSDERALQSVIDKLADPEEFLARVNYLYANRDEKSREEIALKDGRVLDRYSVPMSGSDGKYYGRVWNFRDITEQKRVEGVMRESEERYRTLAEASPDQIFIVGRDDTMKYVNAASLKLFRLPYDQVVGTPRKNLFPPDIADAQGILLKKVFETGETLKTEEKIQFGTQELWIDTSSVPLKDEAGNVTAVLGIAHDISDRKKAEVLLKQFNEELEQQVKSRTEELDISLKEKEGLLREIHHRVRNNLQIVSSIISLQAKSVSDPGSLHQIQEIRMRIGTLALVHEIAYLAKTPESINMRDFLYRCTSKVIDEFGCEPGRINVTITAENVQIALNQAVPCSLIVNELLMNSIRHAFPGKRHGEIRIGFSIAKGNYVLEYGDDGVGLPEGIHPDKAETGGLSLIKGLARQIRGTVESTTRPGTGYTLTFPAGTGRT